VSSDNRRILVVDDDPANCELVAYFLKSLGYNVAIAADGGRALNMDLGDEIELVILDVHMSGYDGPEVLAMIRRRQEARPVKVLALTGDVSEEVRDEMDRGGADGFLTKPVDLDALRDEVVRLMPGLAQREGPLHRRARQRRVDSELSSEEFETWASVRRAAR
jgi:CheY-like chemotaxis protein